VSGVLGIAEGIETALSVRQLYHHSCWASLGARFDAVDFPPEVRTVVAFADNGEAGERTVQRLAERYGNRLTVMVQRPPEHLSDFNDLMREG
jgi:hypothetical protein